MTRRCRTIDLGSRTVPLPGPADSPAMLALILRDVLTEVVRIATDARQLVRAAEQTNRAGRIETTEAVLATLDEHIATLALLGSQGLEAEPDLVRRIRGLELTLTATLGHTRMLEREIGLRDLYVQVRDDRGVA